MQVTSDSGVSITGGEATYSDADGLLQMPGPVEFSKGRMQGSGVGATYDRNREVLWILDQSRIRVAPGPKTGQSALEATSGAAGLARAEHYVRLERNARVTAEGRTLEADDIVVRLSDDEERVSAIELRGNSRISGGTGGPQTMTARDIDLAYAEDGRTLQRAHLVENAVVQFAGAAQGKRIAGSVIDITMGPDGSTVTGLTATERVRVDLPPEGQGPAKTIRAAALVAEGEPGAGLRAATFTGGVDYRETRAARPKLPAITRTALSDSLVLATKPGLGAVERADFRGNVRFTDAPDFAAEAPQGIYHLDGDRLELLPGEGLPGPTPRVTDNRLTVSARTIAFTMSTREMTADTKVRSTMQPQKNRPAEGGGRLPSMLKEDDPVNVTANRLTYKGSGSAAVYSGAATMWQGDETTIKGETIAIDDRTGNLRAEGKVMTFFNVDQNAGPGSTRKRTPTTGTADVFTYDDAKRVATYSGNAHVVGPQGDVTARTIELFLRPGANELERAEAYGPQVVVREGGRLGRGTHLTYTAAGDKYLLMGAPVEIIEENKGTCRRTVAASATFTRTTEAASMQGNDRFPTETRTLSACPPELRR